MHPAPSRRQFLAQLAVAGAALPLVAEAATAKPAQDTAAPAGPAPQPGTLHVFAKPLQWLSYEETAALVAEAGYGGIDYAVRAGGHVLPEKAAQDLPRAVEAARRAGLKVEMITTDITAANDPHVETTLRTAAQLGVTCYRLGNFNYDLRLGVAGTLERLRPVVRSLAELNQRAGLHGAIQNHTGTRVGSAVWDLHELLRDADPRWLGLQHDIRHAVCEGGQSWPLPLRLLAPWIRCTDLKDFRWQQAAGKAVVENTPIGEGIVPFDAYFKLVRELGLGGPVSVHFEYAPFEKGPDLPKAQRRAVLLAALKKDLAALQAVRRRHLG